MPFLLQGILLGFSIAAPVGPIGVLCIRRTLANGMGSGVFSGLGAATADALYGATAAFGLSVVSNFLLDHQLPLRVGGGLFLLYLGYTTYQSIPPTSTAAANSEGLASAYASTFLLTFTNPLTILSFAAVFAGLGIVSAEGNLLSPFLLIFGVFVGSMLWWLILSGVVTMLRQKFDLQRLKWVNQFSGFIIVCFGLYCLTMPIFLE